MLQARRFRRLRPGRSALLVLALCVELGCGPATESNPTEPSAGSPRPDGPTDPSPTPTPDPDPEPSGPSDPSPTGDLTASEIASKFEALASELSSRLAASDIPGATLAVVYADQMLVRGIGLRAKGGTAPVTEHTLFSVASVTKVATATAFMSLVDQGKAKLDAPATDSLPELKVKGPWPASGITAGSLMSHTSGYPNYADDSYDPFQDTSANAISKYLTTYQHLSLDFAPGTQFSYSNFGFALVGLMVERAGGASYDEVVRSRVLGPAQMPDATFSHDEAYAADHAVAHFKEKGKVETYEPFSTPFYQPFGGLYASGTDLARFARVFLERGGAVMSAKSADEMMTSRFQGFIGLGPFLLNSPIGKLVYHGGSQLGFLTEVYVAVDAGLAVAVSVNADWDENVTHDIQRSAFQSFAGLELPP